MWGQFIPSAATEDGGRVFEVPDFKPVMPRYDVALLQLALVSGLKPAGRTCGLIRGRWGFVP